MIPVAALAVPRRREWAGVTAAWLGGLAVLVVWLSITPAATLREQLKVLQPWWLDATALIGAVLLVCALPRLRRMAARARKAPVLCLMALGLCLTVFVAPRTNRIFYDEQIYQSIGRNLSDVRLAQVCNDGVVESGRLQCADGGYNKQPYAYPHVLSLAYRVVGVHDWVAFAVNAIAMTLSVGAVYLLAMILFMDSAAAFFAGLLFALIPQQIVWSATAAVEPTASLAATAAVLAGACYAASDSPLSLAALAVVPAYAIQFRPESLLLLPVVALVAWPRLRLDLRRPHGWWGAVLFLALIAMHVAHLFAVRDASWGSTGPRFAWRYVVSNFRTNGSFYLGSEAFPVVLTVLALIGFGSAAGSRNRWPLAAYFLLFFGIDLAFYAGSYSYGADVRYSLMTYPPVAVFGGLGAAAVVRRLEGRVASVPALAVVTAVLLLQFLFYTPAIRAVSDGAWAARADVRFAKDFASRVPKDSYVLTQNPGMFQLWGVNAGQMARAVASPSYASWLLRQHPGGVYVHWNFWCNVQEPSQPGLCRRAMALGQTTLVAESRERDQRFAFYRLDPSPPR